MKRQLVMKASAPDEVEIAVGTEFKKHFKRADEPFNVTDAHADMLLGSFDYFKELPAEKEAKTTTKTTTAKPSTAKVTKATKTVQAQAATASTKTAKTKAASEAPAANTDGDAKINADVPDPTVTETKIETTDK